MIIILTELYMMDALDKTVAHPTYGRNYDHLSRKQYAKILKKYSDPKFKAAFSLDKTRKMLKGEQYVCNKCVVV